MKKVFGELACRIGCYNKQAFPFILFFYLFGAAFLFNNLDMVFSCNVLKSFTIGQMFMLHDEVHGVANFSASKTFKDLL